MKNPLRSGLVSTFGLWMATAAVSSASSVFLINFSSASGNDITSLTSNTISNAGTLGVTELGNVVNVRTGSTASAGTNAAISLASITGSVIYADYYQQNQLSLLGQPYATLLGPNQIGSTGLSVDISLGMNAWMTANEYSSYTVTVYYAGRSANSKTLLTDATADVFFNDGTLTPSDTVTAGYTDAGGSFWSGAGLAHEFTGDNLTIRMNYLGGTGEDFRAGISAIKIVGIPEPSATLLCGLGILGVLRRRR